MSSWRVDSVTLCSHQGLWKGRKIVQTDDTIWFSAIRLFSRLISSTAAWRMKIRFVKQIFEKVTCHYKHTEDYAYHDVCYLTKELFYMPSFAAFSPFISPLIYDFLHFQLLSGLFVQWNVNRMVENDHVLQNCTTMPLTTFTTEPWSSPFDGYYATLAQAEISVLCMRTPRCYWWWVKYERFTKLQNTKHPIQVLHMSTNLGDK